MADALCGPSNPLQNFQKHSQQDRTLQQDRLISRPGASSGFRSPSQNVGVLDNEFEAFQASVQSPAPPPPSSFFQQTLPARNHTPILAPTPPVPLAASPAPDWAQDFQRLNLSNPSPVSSQNARGSPLAPMVSQGHSQSSITPVTAPQFNSINMYESFGYMAGSGFGPGVGMGYMDQPQQQQEPQRIAVPPPMTFDAEAFERAFDAASAELQQTDRELGDLTTGAGVRDPSLKYSDIATFEINEARLQESIVPPESLLQTQEEQQERQEMTDPDALAHTAGQLLDSVSHETSEKFAQSSFLALMRKLRDREVVVEGENFIESSTNAIANTTGTATEAFEEPDGLLNAQGPFVGQDMNGDAVVFVPHPRPVTPEIDPPAPTLAQWKERLMGST